MLAALFFPYGNGGSSILRSIDEPDVDLLGEKYEVFSEVGMDDKRHAMHLIAHDPSVPSVSLTASRSAANGAPLLPIGRNRAASVCGCIVVLGIMALDSAVGS